MFESGGVKPGFLSADDGFEHRDRVWTHADSVMMS